jgi:hypothetical protein
MVMDAFERSMETDTFHEIDPRAFDAYEMRPPEVIHDLVNRSKASHVVVKALCECQMVSALLEEFAPARAVWVLRDYHDVVNSHLALWTGMPESVRLITGDRDAAGWRGRGMSDETHELVKELYHPDLSNASACALFWYFRNILFFEQGLDRDERVILIHYEDIVSQPHKYVPDILDFVGLKYTPRISAKFSPRSIGKRPPPDIEAPVDELCRTLAERFEALRGPTG